MKVSNKISVLQLIIVLILSIGINTHVIVIPAILQASRRDAWVSILITFVPFLLWGLLLYYFTKKSKQEHIRTWLKNNAGAGWAWLFVIANIIFLVLTNWVTLKELVTWTRASYLHDTPEIALALVFETLCLFSALAGIRSMAITAGILLPFVLVFGYFVSIVNFQYKDYSLLFPVFTQGFSPIFKGMLYTASGFIDLFWIIYLQHHLRSKLKPIHFIILASFILYFTLGTITGAIANFGPYEAAAQRFTSYEQWRLVRIGKYLTNMDFLSIFQWLSGAFTRISLSLFIMVDLLQFKKQKNRVIMLIVICVLVLAAIAIPISDISYLKYTKNIHAPYTVIFLSLLSFALLLPLLKPKSR